MDSQANGTPNPVYSGGVDGVEQNSPFHDQIKLPVATTENTPAEQYVGSHGHEMHAFNMAPMTNALPSRADGMTEGRRPSFPCNNMPGVVGMYQPANMQYVVQQMPQHLPQRNDHQIQHPAQIAQQQQHYMNTQYGQHAGHYQQGARPLPPQLQTQAPFGRVDPYFYTMNQGYSPTDSRFAQVPPYGYGPGAYAGIAQHPRQQLESVVIPSFPRGPPRKPKQSGHALWVGNLPPAARIVDLKDHFARDARPDILSLFLIAKSNCAFVNYRSAAACVAAMNRFHDSRFNGVRLVCRLRRGSGGSAVEQPSSPIAGKSGNLVDGEVDPSTPTIVDGTPSPTKQADQVPSAKVPEKYFIMKSLTTQDLEASARNGVWATQSHNEPALNRAFNDADHVYLIFSANKSGEYFGYARMESPIAGEPMPNQSSASAQTPRSPMVSNAPRTIPTPATATAPRGRIVDDSGRGTIFWEAELSDEEEEEDTNENAANSEMGRPFKISWITTRRLPFHNTRSLRNPWNSDREIKIARDGTEIEPTVAQRLIQNWHRQVLPKGAPSATPYQMALPN